MNSFSTCFGLSTGCNTVVLGKNRGKSACFSIVWHSGSVRISWLCLTVVSKTWVYTFNQKFSIGSWEGQSHPIRKSIFECLGPYWLILVTALQHRFGLMVKIFMATCQCQHLSNHWRTIVRSWPVTQSSVSIPTSKFLAVSTDFFFLVLVWRHWSWPELPYLFSFVKKRNDILCRLHFINDWFIWYT